MWRKRWFEPQMRVRSFPRWQTSGRWRIVVSESGCMHIRRVDPGPNMVVHASCAYMSTSTIGGGRTQGGVVIANVAAITG